MIILYCNFYFFLVLLDQLLLACTQQIRSLLHNLINFFKKNSLKEFTPSVLSLLVLQFNSNYFIVKWFIKVSFIMVYVFVGILIFFTSSLWLLYFGLELQWMLFIIFFIMGDSIWKGLINYVIFNELVGTLLILGLILYINIFFSSLYYGKIGFYPFMIPMMGIILNVSYLYFLFDPFNKFIYFSSFISYSNSIANSFMVSEWGANSSTFSFILIAINFYMIYVFGIKFIHSIKIILLTSSLINFLLIIILILTTEAFLFSLIYFLVYYFTLFFFLSALILLFLSNSSCIPSSSNSIQAFSLLCILISTEYVFCYHYYKLYYMLLFLLYFTFTIEFFCFSSYVICSTLICTEEILENNIKNPFYYNKDYSVGKFETYVNDSLILSTSNYEVHRLINVFFTGFFEFITAETVSKDGEIIHRTYWRSTIHTFILLGVILLGLFDIDLFLDLWEVF